MAEFVIVRKVVAKLSLFVGSGDLIMVVPGWLWAVVMKLWLLANGRGWSCDLVMPKTNDQ